MKKSMYNSYYPENKKPFGAVRDEEKVEFSINIPRDLGSIKQAEFLECKFGEWDKPTAYKMEKDSEDEESYKYKIEMHFKEVRIHCYCFKITLENNNVCYFKKDPRNNESYVSSHDGEHWLMTVYDKSFEVPEDFLGKVMYQIFPDRFYRSGIKHKNVPSDRILKENWDELPNYLPDNTGTIRNNDFFQGDIQGIIKKLPYLENLGVDILYLNPICESNSNHRYNTADYLKIDPMLGTWEDLEELCEKAHAIGMKIILDAVFSHSGSDSVYFNREKRYNSIGAYKNPKSPYYSWYQRIGFNGDDDYDSWWNFSSLPVFNKSSEDYQMFITGSGGVIDQWCSHGIDGLRLDVADELPDFFIELIRIAVKRNGKYFLLGEVWKNAIIGDPYDQYKRTYCLGKGLDSIMNYQFRDFIVNYIKSGNISIAKNIIEIIEQYPEGVLLTAMNLLSSHDKTRILTKLGGKEVFFSNQDRNEYKDRKWYAAHDKLEPKEYEHAKQLLKVAVILQFFLPGIPSIYYGDEVGLTGYSDPFCRKTYPWGHEDKELFKFYKEIIAIKHQNMFLGKAKFAFEHVDSEKLVFIRYLGKEKMIFAINRDYRSREVGSIINDVLKDTVNNKLVYAIGNSNYSELDAYGAIIIKAELK